MNYAYPGTISHASDGQDVFDRTSWFATPPLSADHSGPMANPYIAFPTHRLPNHRALSSPQTQAFSSQLHEDTHMYLGASSMAQHSTHVGGVTWETDPSLLLPDSSHADSFMTFNESPLGQDGRAETLDPWYNDETGGIAEPIPSIFSHHAIEVRISGHLGLMSDSDELRTPYQNNTAHARDGLGRSLAEETLLRPLLYTPFEPSSIDEPSPFDDANGAAIASPHWVDQLRPIVDEAVSPSVGAALSPPLQAFIPQQPEPVMPEYVLPEFLHSPNDEDRNAAGEPDFYQQEEITDNQAESGLSHSSDDSALNNTPSSESSLPEEMQDERRQNTNGEPRRRNHRSHNAMWSPAAEVGSECDDDSVASSTSFARIDDWDEYDDDLRRLYVDEGWTLEDLMTNMFLMHGLRATQKMYKRRFSKCNITKNQKQREGSHTRCRNAQRSRHRFSVHAATSGDRQRARFAQILDQIRGPEPFQGNFQRAGAYRSLERILYDVSIITHVCFESLRFYYDESSWHHPADMTDADNGYRVLKAQLDARTRSAQSSHQDPLLDMYVAYQTLDKLVEPRFDVLLNCIRLFRTFHQLSEEYRQPRILTTVLEYMQWRARQNLDEDHPLTDLYGALKEIEPRAVCESLRVAHLKLFFTLESILGSCHPNSFEYWSVYCDFWGINGSSAKIKRCQRLLSESDEREGPLSSQSMELLDSLGKMAGKSSRFLDEAEYLGLEQMGRCQRVLNHTNSNEYCLARRYLRNAAVLLANIYIGRGQIARFANVYMELIDDLEQGDVDCARQAAIHLAYLVAHLENERYYLDELPRLKLRKQAADARVAETRVTGGQPLDFDESEEFRRLASVFDTIGLFSAV